MSRKKPSAGPPEEQDDGSYRVRWRNPRTEKRHSYGHCIDYDDAQAFRTFLNDKGCRVDRTAPELMQHTWRKKDLHETEYFDVSLTFGKYAHDFVDRCTKGNADTKKFLHNRLENWFPIMLHTSLVDITPAIIQAQRARLKLPRTFPVGGKGKTSTASLSPASVSHYEWFLRSILLKAHAEKKIPASFVEEFDDLQPPTSYRRQLDVASLSLVPEYWQALLNAAAAYDGQTYHLLRLMLNSGLRIGEALALQPKHIDVAGGYIYVEQALKRSEEDGIGRPKGATEEIPSHAERVIPVPHNVLVELQDYFAQQGISGERQFCFSRPTSILHGSPWSYDSWWKSRWEKVEAIAHQDFGLPAHIQPVPYSFRHTYGSAMLDNGMSLYQVSKLLGHKSTQVTEQRYMHENRKKLLVEAHRVAAASFVFDTPAVMPKLASNGWYVDVDGNKTRHGTVHKRKVAV